MLIFAIKFSKLSQSKLVKKSLLIFNLFISSNFCLKISLLYSAVICEIVVIFNCDNNIFILLINSLLVILGKLIFLNSHLNLYTL